MFELVAGARSNLHLRPEQVKMVAGTGVDHNLQSTPVKMVAGACTHLNLLSTLSYWNVVEKSVAEGSHGLFRVAA